MEARDIVRRAGLVVLALGLLLAATLAAAYLHLGAWTLPLGMAIAAAKAGLVVVIFMEQRQAGAAARLAAAAGLVWLALLLALTFADETTRPFIPQGFHTGTGD
jgi:cytochrome c oxidase subunit 4